MFNCDSVLEKMPLLLTEALPLSEREQAHTHIESCALCTAEWQAMRESWRILGDLPEVKVPARLRARFVAEAAALQSPSLAESDNIIPFHRKPATRWLVQAAAIAVLIGGSFVTGRQSRSTHAPVRAAAVQASPLFNIAESAVIPASNVNPDIQGRPDIENVHFFENEQKASEIGVSFDVTQHVTVTGAPSDRNMVKLLSYFLQNRDATTNSRSNAVQWVGDQYTSKGVADPELIRALASLLKNDRQEGVRIKAVDALKSLPNAAPEVRDALVDALKNDPNPAVRMKAVEALANMARQKSPLDSSALETLRQKASQNDENPYVRVKAAEALSSLNL